MIRQEYFAFIDLNFIDKKLLDEHEIENIAKYLCELANTACKLLCNLDNGRIKNILNESSLSCEYMSGSNTIQALNSAIDLAAAECAALLVILAGSIPDSYTVNKLLINMQ